MRFKIAITLAFCVAVLAGCQHQKQDNSFSSGQVAPPVDSSPNAAIRTAIQAHLAHNTNLRMDSFEMELKQVTFDGDHAQAQVEFHAKSGGGTMQLNYALAKKDGVWSVVESTPAGSNFSHPGTNKSQGTGAPGQMGGESDVFQALDKLHAGAPTSTAPQSLPPGHPPVAASPKNKQP
ncbi:MAG: hypothetical protein WCE61_12135 [Candidatus Acidiferrum sp.]